LKLTSGSAKVAGFDVCAQKNDVRKNIGMVFQEPALDSKLTGRENLEFHAMMYGIERKVYKKRIDILLNLVELKEKENVLAQNYSGGMKRRLEIARGLIHRPKVLFLDEPTLGLDSQTRRLIWAYVKNLIKEYKVTVVLTTHYMEEADFLCGRIAIIDHGKILVNETPDLLKAACGADCSLEDVFLKYVGTGIRNIEEREKIW
ncbi:MAG: ATP-binding cassette domain-containing protein, partial [Candidatus Margulisiibacteriota bacterium]